MRDIYKKIHQDPRFHELERKRRVFTWILTSIVLGNVVWYILATAFYPTAAFARLWGTPIADGYTTTWGIVIGISQTILFIVLVGVYILRANGEFDTLKDVIVADAVRAVGAKQ